MLKTCAAQGCRRLTTVGQRFCSVHHRADQLRRGAKRQAHGRNSQAWRRIRTGYLNSVGHLCELRFDGCTQRADTVHLNPELNGNHLAATTNDLTAACRHCHGIIDAPRSHLGPSGGPSANEETVGTPLYPRHPRRILYGFGEMI